MISYLVIGHLLFGCSSEAVLDGGVLCRTSHRHVFSSRGDPDNYSTHIPSAHAHSAPWLSASALFLRQTHRDAQFKEMIAETCRYVVGRQSRLGLLVCRERLFPLDYLELMCRNTAMNKSGARLSQIARRCFISPNHTISCDFQGKPK